MLAAIPVQMVAISGANEPYGIVHTEPGIYTATGQLMYIGYRGCDPCSGTNKLGGNNIGHPHR